MEMTLIEIEECLTDQCYSCTGYYKNDIFSSKIVCKCKCHIIKPSNKQLISTKTEAGLGQSKSRNSKGNQGVKMMLEWSGDHSLTPIYAPDS